MYCTSCPQSVSIPEILGIFNEYYTSDKFMRDSVPIDDASRKKYWDTIPVFSVRVCVHNSFL